MNILQIEDTLKGMPDEVLMGEAQAPSGSAPQYLVISEIQRRTDMRERYAAEQEQPQPTVSDQIVNKGIMALGGQSSPSPEMAGQQPMPQQDMTQQPMLQQAMPEQPMPQQPVAPPQMMNVGGEVELGEGDDISMLLEELGGVSNKIPDNRERDLYMAEFEDSVLSGFPSSIGGAFSESNLTGASIPNAILEDANKFRFDQMLGVDPEELSVLQGAEADLPEVLGYAGGGIVELQEGGEIPEEEEGGGYFSGDQGWVPDWIQENVDPVSAALLLAPIPGARILGGAKMGIMALRAALKSGNLLGRLKGTMVGGKQVGGLKPYRSIMEAIGGSRGAAAGARAEGARTGARQTWRGEPRPGWQPTVPAGQGSIPTVQIGEQFVGRSLPYMNPIPFKGRFWSRTAPMGYGAYGLAGGFGDDAEAEGTGIDDPTIRGDGDADGGGGEGGVYGGGEDVGPEPGSLEWIQEERRKMYESGGGAREEKLQEILSRQREQGTLMQEQAKSDMLSSALMNLGAGIAAGDPSEGLRLAANAVEGIRSSARQGAIEQQNMMDELELAGIDVDQAEKVALLASMQDRISLEQKIRATGSTEMQNAIAIINAQAQTTLAKGHLQDPPVTSSMIDEMVIEALQLATENANQPAFYLQPFAGAGASNGNFTVTEG